MKICDLTQSYAPTGGGVRTYLHAKREFIRNRAGDEHLLIVPGARDSVTREEGTTTYTVASPLLPGSRVYRLLLRSDKVLRILRAERPEVVEVSCAYNLPWTALHYRRARPEARVVGCYMTDVARAYAGPAATRALGSGAGRRATRWAEHYLRALYGRMDATIAISPALAARLREMGVGHVEFVPLGVDPDLFHPARRDPALRRRLGVAEHEPLLVYAGRLDREKRAELVLEAFERLPPALGAALVLVGDGPAREALRERGARHGRVHVLPFLAERAALATLLASADLYVSAMPYETFGLSVLEAQAAGLPVVGVAGGAMLDRVPQGSGVGRLGRVDSVEDLAANVQALLREGALREAGRRARALVETRFSWARTFERIFSLYRSVLSRPSAAAA